jgi:hypothetical protein
MMNQYNIKRGDLNYNRLFFSFSRLTGQTIDYYKIIKPHVILIHTKKDSYILKCYSTKNALLLQIALSKYLVKKNVMIPFTFFPNGQLFIEENGYWGIMPYVRGTSLNFEKVKDQYDGLNQIHLFHKETLSMCFSIKAPRFSLFSYWKKRYETFRDHVFSFNMSTDLKHTAYELLHWGEFVLNKLPLHYLQQLEKKASFEHEWIHGDVASHNFLRLKNNCILLLDCDLLAEAPIEYDYLQYINRIMPHYNWNLSALNKFKNHYIHSLLEKSWFNLALIYPTDLYREWNRCFRNKERSVQSVKQYMEKHVDMRYKVVKELIKEYTNYNGINY